ncbi:serine/threonine-protein kinase [Pseudonocardia sp. DSM 110487]|uniref:serine/threonine-protein kinase n=1 Tax=Pseudonocardia sp. DSM 110487 TaxID=2865833 RepID=UPI0021044295|nr:protein kinase [Pseudonocardia sp. DSM 110487]
MDALTALVAGLVASLRTALAADVCPGGWPWAVTVLGIGVGLLPTAGAVLVAVLRKRIGSRYGAGESVLIVLAGVVGAGLLPLAVFNATGRVFRAVALGREVDGLTSDQLADLGTTVCFTPQSAYLGGYTVAAAFDPSYPVRFGLAVVLLVGFPLVAAVCVATQARLALRRGPSWPAKFFWVPLLVLTLLTGRTPAGSTGHLWIGVAIGAFLGIAVVLTVGTPPREVVRRSLAAPAPAPRQPPRMESMRPPVAARRPPAPAGPQTSLADRLARRFAARQPEPPVVIPQPRTASAHQPPPRPLAQSPRGPSGPRPTLVAPSPPAGAGAPRFRLIRRLGSGGFGRVWLAHDARLGHPVALKAAHAPDPETEERIRREARALVAVRHPHCVRIHDLLPATADPGLRELDGLVIVMEYVEGAPLGDLVRTRGPLDDITAARVWVGLAGALGAAHSRGVLHRDVKPGNVVVDQAGLAHLIDFGIARKTGDSTLTMAGFVLGTPDFLAPEVACGERATPASDSWQLAATISYALTGHPPRGGHPDAVSGLRAAATGAPLSHLPPRSAHLNLLRAAMDTDPRRRPQLRAVQSTLEEWLRRAGKRPDGPVGAGAPAR